MQMLHVVYISFGRTCQTYLVLLAGFRHVKNVAWSGPLSYGHLSTTAPHTIMLVCGYACTHALPAVRYAQCKDMLAPCSVWLATCASRVGQTAPHVTAFTAVADLDVTPALADKGLGVRGVHQHQTCIDLPVGPPSLHILNQLFDHGHSQHKDQGCKGSRRPEEQLAMLDLKVPVMPDQAIRNRKQHMFA